MKEGNSEITIDIVGNTTVVSVTYSGIFINGTDISNGVDIASIKVTDTEIDVDLVLKVQADIDSNLDYFSNQIRERNYA